MVQAGRDLGEDRFQFLVSAFAVVRPLVEANKVRVVAVGGNQRSKAVPNVPSVIESRFPRSGGRDHVGCLRTGRRCRSELRKRIGVEVVAAASDAGRSAERIAATGRIWCPPARTRWLQTLKQQSEKTAAVAKVLGLPRKN